MALENILSSQYCPCWGLDSGFFAGLWRSMGVVDSEPRKNGGTEVNPEKGRLDSVNVGQVPTV